MAWSMSFLLAALLLLSTEVRGLGEIVYAVNCGGDDHIDVQGIRYAKDSNQVGTASDYGKQLIIGRVPPPDQVKQRMQSRLLN